MQINDTSLTHRQSINASCNALQKPQHATGAAMNYTTFNSLTNPQGTRHPAQWADVARLIQNVPAYPDKASQPLIKLGIFEGDSRGAGHILTTISGIEIDYDAGEVTAHSAAGLLRQAGVESVVCSTFTSRMDCPKWRVFCPTSRELPAELRPYLVAALDSILLGISARESYATKQTFFFGRNPASTYQFFHVKGECVDVALKDAANAAYRADKAAKREHEQLAVAKAVHIECKRGESVSNQKRLPGQIGGRDVIDSFNEGHDLRAILRAHGYREIGGRFLSPFSQSGMAGTVILTAGDGKERAYSHGTSDVLAVAGSEGKRIAHDCFSCFAILEHQGDVNAAILEASRLINVGHETVFSHNRHIYRQAQQAAKAQAALAKIKGVSA